MNFEHIMDSSGRAEVNNGWTGEKCCGESFHSIFLQIEINNSAENSASKEN